MDYLLRLVGFCLACCTLPCLAQESTDTVSLLTSCLPLAQVQELTGAQPVDFSRIDRPQPGCSYTDREVISKQTRIVYQREPAYNAPFNIPDLMAPVEGLGVFAEYDQDAGALYVSLGSDGIQFEGRKGKTPLTQAELEALAKAVLDNH